MFPTSFTSVFTLFLPDKHTQFSLSESEHTHRHLLTSFLSKRKKTFSRSTLSLPLASPPLSLFHYSLPIASVPLCLFLDVEITAETKKKRSTYYLWPFPSQNTHRNRRAVIKKVPDPNTYINKRGWIGKRKRNTRRTYLFLLLPLHCDVLFLPFPFPLIIHSTIRFFCFHLLFFFFVFIVGSLSISTFPLTRPLLPFRITVPQSQKKLFPPPSSSSFPFSLPHSNSNFNGLLEAHLSPLATEKNKTLWYTSTRLSLFLVLISSYFFFLRYLLNIILKALLFYSSLYHIVDFCYSKKEQKGLGQRRDEEKTERQYAQQSCLCFFLFSRKTKAYTCLPLLLLPNILSLSFFPPLPLLSFAPFSRPPIFLFSHFFPSGFSASPKSVSCEDSDCYNFRSFSSVLLRFSVCLGFFFVVGLIPFFFALPHCPLCFGLLFLLLLRFL